MVGTNPAFFLLEVDISLMNIEDWFVVLGVSFWKVSWIAPALFELTEWVVAYVLPIEVLELEVIFFFVMRMMMMLLVLMSRRMGLMVMELLFKSI